MEEIKGLEPLNAFYNVWLLSKELHYHCAIFPFWWRRRESNSRLTGASCMFSHYYYNPIKTLVDRKGFEPLTQECKSRIFPIKLTAHKNFGGTGENRTLNFWLQARHFPIKTTIPFWCSREDLNLQPSDYKTVALPFELLERLDPAVGIEPTFTPSKGVYLPLVDTGIGCETWVRTRER